MKLTRNEELKLHGIKALADSYNRKLDELAEATKEIVGNHEDEHGWISDFVYADVSVKAFLKQLP